MGLYEDWAARYRELAVAPWPGPRPLDPDDDPEQLVGRNTHAKEFTSAVLDHPLVVLTGDSGIGKTSLLTKRLVPSLDQEGFIPLQCRVWTAKKSSEPAVLVAQQVAETLGKAPPADDAFDFWAGVDRTYGGRAVLILDQFEELVRYQPTLFEAALRWVEELNRSYRMRVVIALRAEYRHRLRPLEQRARPFTMTTYYLEALDQPVADVLGSGSPMADGQRPINTDASALLVDAWRQRQTGSGVGLLHLQAVLYALAKEQGVRSPIIEADVKALQEEAADNGRSVWAHGLKKAVEIKLGLCRRAAESVGLSSDLIAGTAAVVSRIVPHLSSGDFKLVREEWELAQRAVGTELARLVPDLMQEATAEYRSLARRRDLSKRVDATMPDLLATLSPAARGSRVPNGDPELEADLYQRGVDWAPWLNDPRDVTAGMVLGLPPAVALHEELRRFVFALAWLETAALIRSSTPEVDRTMVSLIHDGFGPALAEVGSRTADPNHTLCRVTGAWGQELLWQTDQLDDPEHAAFLGDSAAHPKVIVNQRWRECTVSASFRHVVFANCDFRGSRFQRCSFHGVAFVNCLLDNATIIDSTIVGSTAHEMAEPDPNVSGDRREAVIGPDGDKYLPDFTIEVEAAMVVELTRQRHLPPRPANAPNELYSRTSGIAAIPRNAATRSHDDDPDEGTGHLHGAGIQWEPQDGGLSMLGGRLSSLQIRDCTFKEEGTLALRHVAGSALDLVEHRGGRIDIFDSAIRGFTITAPVDRSGPVSDTIVRVSYSFLANAWFGDGLQGVADIDETQVRQLVNLNDRSTFVVSTTSSPYSGLVNVGPNLDEVYAANDYRIDRLVDRDELVARPLRTDYRSQPARDEIHNLIDRKELRVDRLADKAEEERRSGQASHASHEVATVNGDDGS